MIAVQQSLREKLIEGVAKDFDPRIEKAKFQQEKAHLVIERNELQIENKNLKKDLGETEKSLAQVTRDRDYLRDRKEQYKRMLSFKSIIDYELRGSRKNECRISTISKRLGG